VRRGSAAIAWVSLSRSRGTFFGGVFLPDEKATTGRRGIESMPTTGPLRVAMRQHGGAESVPCVRAGQDVRAGRIVGEAGAVDDAMPVHAPTSGRVIGIVRTDTAHACDVPAVEIEPDGRDEWTPTAGTPPEKMTLESLVELVRRAGIGGMARDGSATADTLADAATRGVRHVIINAMESEPYLTAEYRILLEYGHLATRTADLIASLLGAARLWLAVDQSNGYLISELRRLAHGTRVRVMPIRNKYPQGASALLVRSIVDREIPYGGSPLDVGAVVLHGCAVLAIGQAIQDGRPCVGRIVTVAGDAVSRPGNYRVPLGTPVHRLIEHVGLQGPVRRIVVGGPMTGVAIPSPDVVTTKRIGAVLLLTDKQTPFSQPGPCIRCGWCLEDCPVGLDPPSLLAAVEGHSHGDPAGESGRLDRIGRLMPHACLGCGVCSYICPARLPLTEGVARACALVPVRS